MKTKIFKWGKKRPKILFRKAVNKIKLIDIKKIRKRYWSKNGMILLCKRATQAEQKKTINIKKIWIHSFRQFCSLQRLRA